MRLRVCICLFAVLFVITAVTSAGYLSVRREYEALNRKYEKAAGEASSVLNYGNGETKQNSKAEEHSGEKEIVRAADSFYYVTLNQDEIIAYSGDHRTVCMRTHIDEEELAAAFIQELKQGIYLENLPALYEYLENCSS